jgi:hypothetical protein
MASSKSHGKNGLIYVGGVAVGYSNAWSINIATESAQAAAHGDTWQSSYIGLKSWSGSITAWNDMGAKVLQNAAIGAITYALLLYPNSAMAGTYYSGNAIFSFTSEASMTSVVSQTASFVGDGALAATGFAGS